VKPTPAQIATGYLASAFLLLGMFHKPLGLSDTWGFVFPLAALVCMTMLFILRRRHKLLQSGTPAPPFSSAKRQRIFWLSLVLMVLTSLSSPFWLPYTGTVLFFWESVILSIISCVFCVTIFVVAWRRAQHRPNQSLEPTAGRARLAHNTVMKSARVKDKRGVGLVSDTLPFGRLWYGEAKRNQ
jgi:hypothetical protein